MIPRRRARPRHSDEGRGGFCTGADERKARNIAANPSCVLTTGCNRLHEGLDVVLEGQAVNVRDDARLREIAGAYVTKYGKEWRFTVAGGELHHHADDTPGLVFEVTPTTVFAFGKGEPYSQTRYRFSTRRRRRRLERPGA
jgi:hypothetical protein